jgi:hypothetical protein
MRRIACLAAALAANVVVACHDLTAPDAARPTSARSAAALTGPSPAAIVVAPDDLHGWSFGAHPDGRACSDGARCRFVTGPTTPPLGTGSVELASVRGRPAVLAFHALAGARLDRLTTLALAVRSASSPAKQPASDDAQVTLELTVDYDLTQRGGDHMGRLVFAVPSEPRRTAAPAWRRVDARSGLWWGTEEEVRVGRRDVRNPCVERAPCSFTRLLRHFPDLGIRDGTGLLLLRARGGAVVNVDSVVIGLAGVTTTYDFEAVAPVVAHPLVESLTVFRDYRVIGAPMEHDSTYQYGTDVPYGFQAPAGGGTLLVTLDGQDVAASGTIRMTQRHVLAAWLQRDVALRAVDLPLRDALRAVIAAGDPVPAYQALLDLLARSYVEVGEAETDDRFARARIAAFDLVRDAASLRRVDDALGGHLFTLDTPASPATVAAARSAPLTSRMLTPTPALAGNGTADPTAIFYVNGIGNSFADAARSKAHLGYLLRRDVRRFRDPQDVVMRLMYNRNDAAVNPPRGRLACLGEAAAASVLDALPSYLGCRALSILVPVTSMIEDLREAVGLLNGRPAPPSAPVLQDIALFADSLRSYREAGRNVIVMPHSEGNLIAQRALERLVTDGTWSPNGRSGCMAVVPMASPTVHYGPIPDRYARPVQLAGDAILRLPAVAGGAVNFPASGNALDDSLATRRASSSSTEQLRFLRELLDGVTIHGMDSYLAVEGGRSLVETAAEEAYQACATAYLTVQGPVDPGSPWQYTMLLGTSAQYGATAFNGVADTVSGTPVRWTSDGAMTSISADGRVTAIAIGGIGSISAQVGLASNTLWIATWSQPPVIDAVTCTRTSKVVENGAITTTWSSTIDARPSDAHAPLASYVFKLELTRRWSNTDQLSADLFQRPSGNNATTTNVLAESWLGNGLPDGGQWVPTGRCIGRVTDIYGKSTERYSQ